MSSQLEEIFLVDLSPLQLPAEPEKLEGILVFNHHTTPHAEPVVAGWLKVQRRDHGRAFSIMHLDGIVAWIVESGLVNELRGALADRGIPVGGAP